MNKKNISEDLIEEASESLSLLKTTISHDAGILSCAKGY